jgi:hypothetical protein
MGFDYPIDLNMPQNYYLNIIGQLLWPNKTIEQFIWFEETPKLLSETEWFRKTMFFLKRLLDVYSLIENEQLSRERDPMEYREILRKISPNDILFTNESFVVALIKIYDEDSIFFYIEQSHNNINVDILLEYTDVEMIVSRTVSNYYIFNRKDYILKSKYFYLEEFMRSYDYLKGDYELAKKALNVDEDNIKFITNMKIKNDPKIAEEILNKDVKLFQYFGDNIKFYNKKIAEFVVLPKDGKQLRHCGFIIKDDPKLVTIAINNNSEALEFASDRLKNNPNFMYNAAKITGYYNFEHIGTLLKNNAVFLLKITKESPLISLIPPIGDKLKNNANFILKLIKIYEYKKAYVILLPYIGDKLKNNPDFMLKIIQIYDYEFKNFDLKKLEEFIKLRNHPQFMYEVIKLNYLAFKLLSQELKNNKIYVQRLIDNIPMMVFYAPSKTKNDPKIMLNLIKREIRTIYFIGEDLKKNQYFILEFLKLPKSEFYIKKIISDDLLDNPNFIVEAAKIKKETLFDFRKHLLRKPEFILKALKLYPETYYYFNDSPSFKNDYNFVLEAVKINGLLYRDAHSDFKRDPTIIKEAYKQNPKVLNYMNWVARRILAPIPQIVL